MFEDILSPKDRAQAAKGKIKILALYIPAFAAWASVLWQAFTMSRHNAPFSLEEFGFLCLLFAAGLEIVWLSFEANLNRIKRKREELAHIPKPHQSPPPEFVRALPQPQSLPKIPFSDFVPGPDGWHIREERYFETEAQVIEILQSRDLTPGQIRLFKDSYPESRYPEIAEYLHRRLLIVQENERQRRAQEERKAIENAQTGAQINFIVE